MDVDLQAVDPAEVASAFESGGAVCRMYDDYESRDEQTRMAAAVTAALCEGRRLAIEAGTGVGKSVAYLVPALAFAQGNGVAVGVATKTNALMDQLVFGELPALADVLEDDFEYVALKGYDHYLCLRKLDRILAREEGAQDETVDAAMLLAWVAQTSWSDIDSFNIHWRGDLRVRLTANAEDCTRRRCRHYPGLCYLHGVRRRAASAHVVVTNHSLLFRDLVAGGGILPPVRHWIVDEAHGAEAEARDQLSAGIDHASARSLLRRLTAPRGGMLRGVRASADDAGDEGLREAILDACDGIREAAATALTVATSFFDMLKDLGEGAASDYERTELRITPELRETQAWAVAAGPGRSLVRKLGQVLESGKRLFTALEEAGIEATDDRADLAGVLSRLAEHGEGLGLALDGGDDSYVYSATIDRRREVVGERLLAQTIDVGAVLAERFYPEVRGVVFTSATIATGDDFSHFAHGVGLDVSDPEGWDAVRLDSSYDFERQMAAYVPADLPEPRDAAYLDALESFLFELHVEMGGSVLTLFTNRRDLDTLYLRLVDRLEAEGLRLVAQRPRESVKRVRDQFVSDVDCSLFATKSFWEGFDAKGDTLRCVAVVRLPFAHPGDPLLEELKARHPAAWWERFYLPQAVLELKQAAGRLIRSSTDEGCLVLCDSRVAGTKPYAREFLEALPVDDVTVADSEEVLRAIGERFRRR
jgi:ATP-dependent DNA helicase DinG